MERNLTKAMSRGYQQSRPVTEGEPEGYRSWEVPYLIIYHNPTAMAVAEVVGEEMLSTCAPKSFCSLPACVDKAKRTSERYM
jgi:hypothetical protein